MNHSLQKEKRKKNTWENGEDKFKTYFSYNIHIFKLPFALSFKSIKLK